MACLVKRWPSRQAHFAAARTQRTVSAAVRPTATSRATIAPRSIDPVQPKIDLLPRPEPRPAPASVNLDSTRFERALAGPDPNAGIPRKAIIEIRPAVDFSKLEEVLVILEENKPSNQLKENE